MSTQEPESSGDVPKKLSRLENRHRGLEQRLRTAEDETADSRVGAVVAAVSVGLLGLLATTWLTPSPANDPDFASPHTGLGLFDGDIWSDDETVARWVVVIGLLAYIIAAIVALVAVYGGKAPVIAAVVGLVATIGVILAKPEYDFAEADWDYAWQSPPYLACLFWLVLIALAGSRLPSGAFKPRR